MTTAELEFVFSKLIRSEPEIFNKLTSNSRSPPSEVAEVVKFIVSMPLTVGASDMSAEASTVNSSLS